MTFLAGGALAGLLLLVPLVILHLRQRAADLRDVPSLLLWHEFALDAPGRGRRWSPPPLPLLLALQAVALILLVVALAQPLLTGPQPRPVTVLVLDDSFWMTAPGALPAAKREAVSAIRATPSGTRVAIVVADGAPAVLYRGPAAGAEAVVNRISASAGAPSLSRGLQIAAGLLTGSADRIVVIRARDDAMPASESTRRELHTMVAGPPRSDQGIFDPTARCGIGTPSTCEVFATVANFGSASAAVHVRAHVAGHPSVSVSAQVSAGASVPVRFLAAPGEQVTLSLAGSDGLSIDDHAWVTVPGDDNIPRSAVVTVVGRPADARSLAQAFAAVPGVTLRLETPSDYRAAVARTSDLVVLDGAVSQAALPPAPAVMLVDPSRLPGGEVGAVQADPTPSGQDSTSPLLQDTDLSSLSVDAAAARRLSLPHWLAPVLWSPSGPLLAAGDDGHVRLIAMAFQPGGSSLAQLTSFPILAANIVRWSLGWAPGSATAGAPISVDALPGAQTVTLRHGAAAVARVELRGGAAVLGAQPPGVYTVSETGPQVSHQATIDVNLAMPGSTALAPVDLRAARLAPVRAPGTPLAPWLLAAALVVLACEWVYSATRQPPVAA